MDLILHYPKENNAFIGLFMMNNIFSGKGIGSNIIKESLNYLKEEKVTLVKLAFMKNNQQSKSFWKKNSFEETGIEINNGQEIMVVLQKKLV